MKGNKQHKQPPIFIVKLIMGLANILEKFQRRLMPPQFILMNHAITHIALNRMIFTVAELGVADLLKDGPKSMEQLAQKTGCHNQSLYRVLRTLASVGVFKENKDRVFSQTPISRHLEHGMENTMVDFIKVAGSDFIAHTWRGLPESVKNGKDYYANSHSMHLFEWMADKPAEQELFDVGMTSVSIQSDLPVVAGHDFSSYREIVDIGGGYGSQLRLILESYPGVKGVLFDQEQTIQQVKSDPIWQENGLMERMEFRGGDFFKSVPTGYDVYFMKSIIHDWDDRRAIQILRNCRKAMKNDSTFIMVENLVSEKKNQNDFSKFLDINLLVLMGGLARTTEETRELLKQAGLKLTKVIPTASPFTLLICHPI